MAGKGTYVLRILLVEDDRAVREMARMILEHESWEVVEASSLEDARDCLRNKNRYFDLFIIDLHLPDGLGTQLVEEIRRSRGTASVVIATGDPGRLKHLKGDAAVVLPKPFTPLQLTQAARHGLARADHSA